MLRMNFFWTRIRRITLITRIRELIFEVSITWQDENLGSDLLQICVIREIRV